MKTLVEGNDGKTKFFQEEDEQNKEEHDVKNLKKNSLLRGKKIRKQMKDKYKDKK